MKKSVYIIIGSIILLGTIYYFYSKGNQENPYTFGKVEKTTITQTVSVTGTVEADPKIDMQFQSNGKIEKIYVKEGEKVKKDQVIAGLQNENYSIQLQGAEAVLKANQAKLDQEIAGVKKETININETHVNQAKTDLANNKVALENLKKINQEEIKKASLQVSSAELNVQKAEEALSYAKSKSQEDLKSAENAYKNSKTNLEDVIKTAEVNVNSAYDDIDPIMATSLITANDNLTAVDNILGVDGKTVIDSDDILLGAKDVSTLITAKEAYSSGKTAYQQGKKIYDEWVETKKKEDIKKTKEAISKSLEGVRTALDATYVVLENSISTQEKGGLNDNLKTYKDFISGQLSTNATAKTNLNNGYQAIETALVAQDSTVNAAQTALDTSASNLALAKVSSDNNIKNATLNLEDSKQKLAQAEQNLSQIKISTKKQEDDLEAQIKNKEAFLENANAELGSIKAPPRAIDLKALQANVEKAESDVESAQYNYDQTLIKTPVDGVIVDIKKDVGENITANEIFVTINAPSLIIKSNVSETDISKIKIGNEATMTFDAFDFSEEVQGEIVGIAPAETIIEGVVYYQVKISVKIDKEKKIKTGMTANLKIKTADKKDVLAVPIRSVKYEENKRFVQILQGGKVVNKEIQTGLEGDQFVEILSGLSESEEIITFIKTAYQL